MNIYPAIDIKDGKCVRLTQGDFNQETIYDDDPVKVATQWKKKGARWLHLIDLDGAKMGKIVNKQIIKKIKEETGLFIQVGGGIRSLEDANNLISIGIDRLIIGTVAFENLTLLKKLLKKFPGKIVVSIDAEKGQIKTHGWLKLVNLNSLDAFLKLKKMGVKAFIYTDILKDGMMAEPNYQVIEQLLRKASSPLTIAGGISSIREIKRLKSLGVDGVILGKALYERRIILEEALKC